MADAHPVLQYLIETEFRDLEGAAIEGQLCFTDEAINLGLDEVVRSLQPTGSETSDTGDSTSGSPLPDPSVFTNKVRIEYLRYRTDTGKTSVEIRAALDK